MGEAVSGTAAREEARAKARAKARKIKIAVGSVIGVLIVLLAVFALLWALPILKVSSFEVEGNQNLEAQQVQEATGVAIGENLLRVDNRAAAAGVAQLPWVSTATVTRKFPSTLEVSITERDVLAYVEESDGPHLIDENGNEFFIDMPPQTAVEVRATKAGTEEMKDAVEIIAAVPAEIRSEVATLDAAGPHNFVFRMKDERTVTWGANEDNQNKALAFATVLKMEGQQWNITNPELVTKR